MSMSETLQGLEFPQADAAPGAGANTQTAQRDAPVVDLMGADPDESGAR